MKEQKFAERIMIINGFFDEMQRFFPNDYAVFVQQKKWETYSNAFRNDSIPNYWDVFDSIY